jgi:hypothetical protein
MKVGLRVPLLTIAAFFFLPDIAAAQDNAVQGNPLHLQQGWSADTIDRWHFISQGTPLIPYEWFLALEQPEQTALIRSPENLQKLGFLVEPAGQNSPDGLAVGLYKLAVNFDDGKFKCWKGNWLGLGCAGCHTGQVNYRGQQIRIEGGRAHIDIDGFVDQLKNSIVGILKNPQAGASFLARVGAPPLDVQKGLACFAEIFRGQAEFNHAVAADTEDTPAGFGRLDAHGKGLNQLLAAPLKEPRNYAHLTAPVRFPALWDTPRFNWVLYNGSIRQPLARNMIEALGVQAPIRHDTMLGDNVVHAIEMENVIWGQRMLMDLRSPGWPESILGRLDLIKIARGKQLYANECADCHDSRAAGMPSERGACDEIRIPLYDLDTIGTDPELAMTFNKRRISLSKIPGGPDDIANYKAAEIATQKITEQWSGRSPENAAATDMVNCGRPNRFRAPLSYRARPLNGIWAMAPYLHNGSVPSLYDLLLPPDQRPKRFYVGNWEFNPEIVGYETKQFPDAFPYDTARRGNSNAGHGYGTDLSEKDRKALVEYLKTL